MRRSCDVCGVQYEAKRPSSRFCGPACRQRNQRNPVVTPIRPSERPSDQPRGVYAATVAELEAAGRVGTTLGAKALALAARIDAGQDTGSALAAMVRQHDVTMADAVKGAQVARSALDELRARRDARRA